MMMPFLSPTIRNDNKICYPIRSGGCNTVLYTHLIWTPRWRFIWMKIPFDFFFFSPEFYIAFNWGWNGYRWSFCSLGADFELERTFSFLVSFWLLSPKWFRFQKSPGVFRALTINLDRLLMIIIMVWIPFSFFPFFFVSCFFLSLFLFILFYFFLVLFFCFVFLLATFLFLLG